MSHDIGHGPEGAFVLVADGNGLAALAVTRLLCEAHRDLGAEFGELEWAGEKCDDGASRGSCGTEASYRVHVRVVSSLVDMGKHIVAHVSLHPVCVYVL